MSRRRPFPSSSVRAPRSTRRARPVGLALLATTLAAAVAAAAVPGAAATSVQAAPAAPDGPGSSPACPEAWSGALGAAQAFTGLTTVQGTTPESFSGAYVDTIPNGIGRGRDMLVFRLSGSRITNADGTVDAGVWSGISGSPLYDTASGKLVGAVSYGRTLANDVIAGVTPAADMYGLLDRAGADRPAPAAVPLPRAARRKLAEDGVAVRRSAALRRLESPTYVSGVAPERAQAVAERARRTTERYVAGATAAPSGPDLPVVAGGNMATTWSHGDITLAAIGSVTAVCGDRVLAFGHPDAWTGDSDATLHGARALGIANQGVFGAFKDVAQIGAPAGALDQDRLEGVSGTLGAAPPSAGIHTTASYAGDELAGHSVVSVPELLPDVAALQAFNDVETAMNVYSPTGESRMRWTISFDVAGGGSRTYTRSQRYSDRRDLFYDLSGDIAADVATLLDNPFREVTITDVSVANELADEYRAYRIGKVQVRRGGRFRTVRPGSTIVAPRGRHLAVRTTFVPANRWTQVPTKTRTTFYRVQRGAAGAGRLTLQGHAPTGDSFFDFFFFDEGGDEVLSGLSKKAILFGGKAGPPRPKPRNLAQLLAAMGDQPAGNQVSTSLAYPDRRARDRITVKSVRRQLPAIVEGKVRLRVRFR